MFVIALSLSYIWVDNIGYHFKKGTNNKIIIWRILRRRPIIWKWYIPFCAILRSVQSLNYRNWRSSGMWICVWPWVICCRITRFIRSVLITWFTMGSSQNEKIYNRFITHFAYILFFLVQMADPLKVSFPGNGILLKKGNRHCQLPFFISK